MYFGGKSRCANLIWRALGDVRNYVEPFFGSGAVLLARPRPFRGTETVNDACQFVENFWRAVQAEPDTVAKWLDWPVNETRLEAVHKWLVTAARKEEHARRMKDEMGYYDPKIAGLWCWGLCAWIGKGWCAGAWYGPDDERNAGTGVNVRDKQRGGKRPHLNRGQGIHKQRPHLGDAGQGVHKQLQHLGDAGQGECVRRLEVLVNWMRQLRDRLRNVRVCCGDWSRVCTHTPTSNLGLTGIFLDPPYSDAAGRDENIYARESLTVAHDVRAWCLQRGCDKDMRIVLAGYEGEHEELEVNGWRVESWTANGGYGVQSGNGEYTNKYKERLWMSPACVDVERRLFV